MKIIFLDIDGVLLSGRAAILPANAGLGKLPIGDRMARATFDAPAVELINRVASRASANIVVHSDWRKTIGIDETRAKLLEQGLDPAFLHPDWHTPMLRLAEKPGEIRGWLEDHRLTATPVPPPLDEDCGVYVVPDDPAERDAFNAQMDEYLAAQANYGIDYIVIDDHRLSQLGHRQVVVDQNEGFSVADYRVALGMLGGSDPGMGAFPVAPEDWAMVLAAHDAVEGWGPQLSAASAWLHTPVSRNDAWPRARRLRAEEVRKERRMLAAFGFPDADDDYGVARYRRLALADLPKAAPEGEVGD